VGLGFRTDGQRFVDLRLSGRLFDQRFAHESHERGARNLWKDLATTGLGITQSEIAWLGTGGADVVELEGRSGQRRAGRRGVLEPTSRIVLRMLSSPQHSQWESP
jgi:hypothetical protein